MNGEQLTTLSLMVFEFVKSNWPLIRAGLVVLAVLGMGSAFRWNSGIGCLLTCHDLARQAVERGMTKAIVTWPHACVKAQPRAGLCIDRNGYERRLEELFSSRRFSTNQEKG
jgi:hypothetical protein